MHKITQHQIPNVVYQSPNTRQNENLNCNSMCINTLIMFEMRYPSLAYSQVKPSFIEQPLAIPNKPTSSLINDNLRFNSNLTQITFVTLSRFLKITKNWLALPHSPAEEK